MLTHFAARWKQADLSTEGEIDDFVKKTAFNSKLKILNKKFTSNKRKDLLVGNELKKLQIHDLSLFIGKVTFSLVINQFYTAKLFLTYSYS